MTKCEVANQALATFAPGTQIQLRKGSNGGWQVKWTDSRGTHLRRWATQKGSDFYPSWHRKWGHGGTATTALAQLIRWLQGRPVLPLSSWRYWASDTCKLLRHGDADAALEAMAKAGYPEKAVCVLCGNEAEGLDWWSLDGVSGPCCSWTKGCRQTTSRHASVSHANDQPVRDSTA